MQPRPLLASRSFLLGRRERNRLNLTPSSRLFGWTAPTGHDGSYFDRWGWTTAVPIWREILCSGLLQGVVTRRSVKPRCLDSVTMCPSIVESMVADDTWWQPL